MLVTETSQPIAFSFADSILDLFSRQVMRTPDAIAAEDDQGPWSFLQMKTASDALAGNLGAQGISKGSVVAIYASRFASLPVAVLGVWKSGAAVLILDSSYPPMRLAGQAEFAAVQAVLSLDPSQDLPPEFARLMQRPGFKLQATVPRRPNDSRDEQESVRPGWRPPELAADDPAYILFTSGTTGQPKAIVTPHSALPHFLAWYTRTVQPTPQDSFSLLSGLSHDPVFRDMFGSLVTGARLQVPKPEITGLPRQLLNWMRSKNITISHITPSAGRMLSRLVAMGGQPIPSLRNVFFGGEPLRWADVADFRRVAPNAQLVNCYGASETPQIMGFHVIPPGATAPASGVVPITSTIDDVQLLTLDANGGLLPDGVAGEVGVRTGYLSRGYLNAPALTAERFVPNPLRRDEDDRRDLIYRTGDHCRPAPGGGIELTGRTDTQVTIRGFRVELEEIEDQLKHFPGVLDAAVVTDHDPVDPHLYACIQALPGFDKSECRRALALVLPQYMVPNALLEVAHLPLTPNGKLDRKELLSLAVRSVAAE